MLKPVNVIGTNLTDCTTAGDYFSHCVPQPINLYSIVFNRQVFAIVNYTLILLYSIILEILVKMCHASVLNVEQILIYFIRLIKYIVIKLY